MARGDTFTPNQKAAVPVVPQSRAATITSNTGRDTVAFLATQLVWGEHFTDSKDIMTSEHTTTWHRLRTALILSQLGPTLLLITTIALLQFGLAQTDLSVRIASAGILLASGILGALVQFQVASEAQQLSQTSGLHASSARWMWVVKYVTPTIFLGIYLALMVALFA